jgi:undecaprenyl-diphosphatase
MNLIDAVDSALFAWLRAWHAPWLDVAMTWISASGGAGLIWLLLGVIGLSIPRHRAAGWRVMLTVALCYAVVDGVAKPLIARPRPPLTDAIVDRAERAEAEEAVARRHLPPMPTTASFPSGHATSTFGAAVAVSRMWPHARVAWWILALLVGYSRIYLGHHYPLDVVGGALLGGALAFWVLGGRHRATYASTLPNPLPQGVVVRP